MGLAENLQPTKRHCSNSQALESDQIVRRQCPNLCPEHPLQISLKDREATKAAALSLGEPLVIEDECDLFLRRTHRATMEDIDDY